MLLAIVGHYIVGSFVSMHENLCLTKGDNFYAHFGPLRGIQGWQNLLWRRSERKKIAIFGRTFVSDHHHSDPNPTYGGLNESLRCQL